MAERKFDANSCTNWDRSTGSKRACPRPASRREKSSSALTSFNRRKPLRCASAICPRLSAKLPPSGLASTSSSGPSMRVKGVRNSWLTFPADPNRLPRGEHDAHRRLEALRPAARRPDRGGRPVEPAHAPRHVTVASKQAVGFLVGGPPGARLGHLFAHRLPPCAVPTLRNLSSFDPHGLRPRCSPSGFALRAVKTRLRPRHDPGAGEPRRGAKGDVGRGRDRGEGGVPGPQRASPIAVPAHSASAAGTFYRTQNLSLRRGGSAPGSATVRQEQSASNEPCGSRSACKRWDTHFWRGPSDARRVPVRPPRPAAV